MLKPRLTAVIWICFLLVIASLAPANADITIGKITTYHPGDDNLFDLRISNFTLDVTTFDLTWHIYATFDNITTDQCDPFSQEDCDCIYFKAPLRLEAAGSYNNWNEAWWIIKDGSNTLYSGNLDSFFIDEFSFDEEYSSSFMGISLPKWIKAKGSVALTSDGLGSITLYINDASATHVTGFPTYKVTSCKAELNTSLFSAHIPPLIALKGNEVVYHPEGVPYVDPGAQVLEIRPRYNYTSKFTWNRIDLDNFDPNAPTIGEYTVRYIVADGSIDYKGIGALPNTVNRTVHIISADMPTVKSVSPADDASIPINSNISATFSMAMNPSTINASSFLVSDNSGNPISGVLSYNSKKYTATFNPNDDLSYGMSYTAILKTDITIPDNSGGTGLQADYTWSFSTPLQTNAFFTLTGSTLDTMAISTAFSSEISTSTVNTETFFVKPQDGSIQIAGTVSCPDSKTAVFIPDEGTIFNPAATYKASITSEVKDLIGNPVKAEDWLFTVANLTDSDGDGHTAIAAAGDDCDDANVNIYPGASEVCGDGIDQDCSGEDLACETPNNGGGGTDTGGDSGGGGGCFIETLR